MIRGSKRQPHAGKYTNRITIIKKVHAQRDDGLTGQLRPIEIVTCFADIRTIRGYSMIMNGSDFEFAYVNFTIGYCQKVIDAYYNGIALEGQEPGTGGKTAKRNLFIVYNNVEYEVKYLNNVDLKNIEIEMQAERVTGHA